MDNTEDEIYYSIFREMRSGMALLHTVTPDGKGPKDYLFADVNPAYENITGMAKQQVVGKTIAELGDFELYHAFDWMELLVGTAGTDKKAEKIKYYKLQEVWYSIRVCNLASDAVLITLEEAARFNPETADGKIPISEGNEPEAEIYEWQLQKVQEIARVGYWERNLETGLVWGSEEAFQIYGLSRKSPYIDFSEVNKCSSPKYREQLDKNLKSMLEDRQQHDVRYEIRSGDGKKKYVHLIAKTDEDQNGIPYRMIGIVQDITEEVHKEKELEKSYQMLRELYDKTVASENELKQKNEQLLQKNEEIVALYEELTSQDEELRSNYEQLEESLAKLRKSEEINQLVLEAASEGIWQYDFADNRYIISRAFVESLGYEEDELSDISRLTDITHPEDKEAADRNFYAHINGEIPRYDFEYRMRRKDGTYQWVRSSGKVLKDPDGKAYLMAGTFADVTKIKEQRERLEYLAYYDVLTGLPNRTSLLIELEKQRKVAEEQDRKLAVIYLELDGFNDINNTLGHDIGDQLLQAIAHRLSEHMGPGRFAARMNGDEFVLLLLDIAGEDEVYRYCREIQEEVSRPLDYNQYNLSLNSGMGIVIYRGGLYPAEEMIKDADMAMYCAKGNGKNSIQLFCENMRADMQRRLLIGSKLNQALKQKDFSLHYQPQIHLGTGKIRAFEALLRWTDEELGVLSPAEFIPIAESTGIIVELGNWILKEACYQAKRSGLDQRGILISVNLSAVQLSQKDFVDKIKETLEETELEAAYLELEVTETAMIGSLDTAAEMFDKLRELGIKISLDDFGTGYSSLIYLKLLPIDTLKIDKSFIDGIDGGHSIEAGITEAVITLMHFFGIEVIAEGVETPVQRDYLKKCSCDSVQGYVFSKAVAADEVEALADRIF